MTNQRVGGEGKTILLKEAVVYLRAQTEKDIELFVAGTDLVIEIMAPLSRPCLLFRAPMRTGNPRKLPLFALPASMYDRGDCAAVLTLQVDSRFLKVPGVVAASCTLSPGVSQLNIAAPVAIWTHIVGEGFDHLPGDMPLGPHGIGSRGGIGGVGGGGGQDDGPPLN